MVEEIIYVPMKHYFITLTFVLHAFFTSFLKGDDKNMTLWISSFQDQSYYEQMAELYREKAGGEINLSVEAYGFREMPDKLGAVMRTGVGAPDLAVG